MHGTNPMKSFDIANCEICSQLGISLIRGRTWNEYRPSGIAGVPQKIKLIESNLGIQDNLANFNSTTVA